MTGKIYFIVLYLMNGRKPYMENDSSKWIAHIDGDREQTIYAHLKNVAELTSYFCRNYKIPELNVAQYAYTTGVAHDIGKYSKAFQKRIRGDVSISVDHSTAGARELTNLKMPFAAFAVAGHHGGIPNGRDCIYRVKEKEIEDYSCYSNEIHLEEYAFRNLSSIDASFFIRMLFSALVDGDFLDTEKFMSRGKIERISYASIDELRKLLQIHINPWLKSMPQKSEINKIRTEILRTCIEKGKESRGIYSLTIPTGGGKTISSLAFALEHAKQNHMDRIIYVIPYTSIIEQNVAIFKGILGNENVLAHYSTSLLDNADDEDCFEKHKLSIENWDAPVIVTTNVQFFESLYSNKVSKCRKLHNISNSVIVFDEAQMIPLNCLKPCVKAIQELVQFYQATAVLCTATQPALEHWLQPLHVENIYEEYENLFNQLKRVNIKNLGKVEQDELVNLLRQKHQGLIIVNTKKTAQEIYERLPESGSYHLSTNLLPVDRRRIIGQIKQCLDDDMPCRVVSTSLVEAGVDLDFPVVFREKAGIDSIIQAAGRCNREGRRDIEESIVWVFQLDKKIPDMIAKNIAITNETMEKYREFDNLEAIHYYFETLQMIDDDNLDQYGIIHGFERDLDGIRMPFQRVGEIFHLIDTDTKTLIIPVNEESRKLVDDMNNRINYQLNFKVILQRLGKYSINIYENVYRDLLNKGGAYELVDGIVVLQNLSLYSSELGLCMNNLNGAMIV